MVALGHDRPSKVLAVPHLGNLLVTMEQPTIAVFQTFSGSPDEIAASVEINKVEYHRIKVPVYSYDHIIAKNWDTDSLVWTVNHTWAARSYDVTAQRCDAANRGRNISDSALQKLVKRVVLFFDDWHTTDEFMDFCDDADRFMRGRIVASSTKEIERLRDLLAKEERKLADALNADVGDLINLRRAFERGDDLHTAFEGD